MLAARNRLFRLAAAAAAGSWLVLGVAQLVDTDRNFREHALGGVESGEVIRAAAHLVGVVGWLVIATAFGRDLDWRRLRLGASIVVVTLFSYAVGSAVVTITIADSEASTNYRVNAYFGTLADLLIFGAAAVMASGLVDAHRGATRAGRLRHGAFLVAGSFVASTVAVLYLQAFYGEYPLIPEVQKIGLDVLSVGAFVPVVAAGTFARGATQPLRRREAAIFAAGIIAVLGTVVICAGEALIAVGYHEANVRGSGLTSAWLAVGSRALVGVAFALAALGARRATRGPNRPPGAAAGGARWRSR